MRTREEIEKAAHPYPNKKAPADMDALMVLLLEINLDLRDQNQEIIELLRKLSKLGLMD